MSIYSKLHITEMLQLQVAKWPLKCRRKICQFKGQAIMSLDKFSIVQFLCAENL
jgi:hypothetical protein